MGKYLFYMSLGGQKVNDGPLRSAPGLYSLRNFPEDLIDTGISKKERLLIGLKKEIARGRVGIAINGKGAVYHLCWVCTESL